MVLARVYLHAYRSNGESERLHPIGAGRKIRPPSVWPVDLVSADPHAIILFWLEEAHWNFDVARWAADDETSLGNEHDCTSWSTTPRCYQFFNACQRYSFLRRICAERLVERCDARVANESMRPRGQPHFRLATPAKGARHWSGARRCGAFIRRAAQLID